MGRKFYWLMLLGVFLGAAGAAADVSWHFSRLFDEFSPPHNIATSGMVLNIVLLYWALWRHRAELSAPERTGLLLNAAGVALFLVTAPLDLLVHLIYGIDITTWSPTHLSLFYSAVLGLVGLLLAWVASPDGRKAGAWLLTGGIGTFLLSATLFPAYQQEYAAVALASLQRTGRAPWYVAPDMWRLAGPQAEKLAHGNIPDWLYIVYIAACVAFSLALVSALIRGHWASRAPHRLWHAFYGFGAATGVVALYLLFRLTARSIFGQVGMPTSELPWWELPLAAGIDLALLVAALLPDVLRAQPRVRILAAALGAGVGAAALSQTMELLRAHGDTVPTNPAGALPFAILAALLAAGLGAAIGARILTLAATAPAARTVRAEEPVPVGVAPALPRAHTFGPDGRVAHALERALRLAGSRGTRG